MNALNSYIKMILIINVQYVEEKIGLNIMSIYVI